MDKLTKDQFLRVVPKNMKNSITDNVVDKINELVADSDIQEIFRENILGYTSVLQDGRWQVSEYIKAVKYISYKLLGSTNIEAYAKVFPERFQRLIDEEADNKTINSYATGYNKNKLVNMILEQTMVPIHIYNMDVYQKAINTQAGLMISANSEKVRSDAADSLLRHLKPPETKKIEIDVNNKEDKTIDELRATTQALVDQQKEMLKTGTASVKEIAHSKLLIDGEIVDDN